MRLGSPPERAREARVGRSGRSLERGPIRIIARDLVRVQVRVKSIYRLRGVSTAATRSVYGTRQRAEWIERLPVASRRAVGRLYEHFDFLSALKQNARAFVGARSRTFRITPRKRP